MSKTVLVTGATGFIGSNLCNRLYNTNHTVIAIGTKGENKPLCHKYLPLTLDGISWDLVPQIDVCFHQAANNDTTDMDLNNMLRANYVASSNLFYRLVREKGCKQFVYASSCSVYGKQPAPYDEKTTPLEPLNPYAQSKVLLEQFAEQFAIEYGVNVIGLRYSNVYGPGENHKGKRASMVSQLLQKLIAGERPKIFADGTQARDWVYIEDVVEANMLSSQYNGSGVFNVGSGEAMSYNDVIRIVNEELGKNIGIDYIENPYAAAFQDYTLTNLDHAKKIGYTPKRNLEESLREYIRATKKATA